MGTVVVSNPPPLGLNPEAFHVGGEMTGSGGQWSAVSGQRPGIGPTFPRFADDLKGWTEAR